MKCDCYLREWVSISCYLRWWMCTCDGEGVPSRDAVDCEICQKSPLKLPSANHPFNAGPNKRVNVQIDCHFTPAFFEEFTDEVECKRFSISPPTHTHTHTATHRRQISQQSKSSVFIIANDLIRFGPLNSRENTRTEGRSTLFSSEVIAENLYWDDYGANITGL